MKKVLSTLVCIVIAITIRSQTTTVIFTNNGIAPIPAFTLGKPAGLAFVNANISKHIEIDPDVTFSLATGKLWFSDVWLKYSFWSDSTKKWLFTIGADFPSYFGQSYTDAAGKTIDQIVLYPTAQLKVKHTINKNLTATLDYWYTQATKIEYGTKGSYISLSTDWNKTLPKKVYSLELNPNVFYLTYSDGTKGLAGSFSVNLFHIKSGIFIGTQGLVPITVKSLKSTWNISVGLTRKLS